MKPLPRLAGRGLAAVRLIGAALLAMALAAMAVGQFREFQPLRLIHALVLIAVAATLLRRRAADPVASMLSLAFLLWAVTTSSVWAAMSVGEVALALLDRVRFLLFVTAMLLFPSGTWRPRWTAAAAAATGLVFILGLFAAVGLAPVVLHQVLAMGCAALAVAALRQRFLELPPGIQRQQIKWVAFGLAVGLALVAVSRVGGALDPPAAPGVRDLLFDAGLITMTLGVLVSLLRYRLYDADAAISRSTAVAAVTIALVGIFAGSEATIQLLSQSWFGDNAGAVSGGIAAAIAAALTAPLHQRVTSWTERRFQWALFRLRGELPPLLADLRETVGLAMLADRVLAHIERALRPARAALLIGGSLVAERHVEPAEAESWTNGWERERSCATGCEGDDALFPLRVPLSVEGTGTIGWILVGERLDGSLHGKDEREALTDIAAAVARAVWIVREREARDAAAARLVERLEWSIRTVETRLTALEQTALIHR